MIAAHLLIVYLTAAAPGEPEPGLPAEASAHNDRALAHIEAREYAQALDELERAYALMPDPLRYRGGRGDVLGSMRSALNSLYEQTGDPRHLVRLRGMLLLHLEALLLALGPEAAAADSAALLDALHAVEAKLPAQPPPLRLEPPPMLRGATPATPMPSPSPPPVTDAPSARRLRIAGGALLGVGSAAVAVMSYAIVAHVDRRNRLRSLTAAIEGADEPASDANFSQGTELYTGARDHAVLAIVTGAVGAALIATGAALRVAGKRRSRSLSALRLAPTHGRGAWGLQLAGGF